MGDNFTGREHDSDVIAHPELVEQITTSLNAIADTDVPAAYEEIKAAVDALNNVKGLGDYVGSVSCGEIKPIFLGEGGVQESIKALATAMNESAESIKEYDESEWYEKAGSTILMGFCKVGEGLLGIIEDLGDGVMTLIGFATNDWFGTGAMSEGIKAEWSHNTFAGAYEALGNKSAFTEDSVLAGGIKVVSQAVGYLAIAATTAGTFSGLAGTGGAAATFASSTTIANTALATLTGLGVGEENGLRQGKGFYEAFVQNALPQGVIQGGIAFAAGKAGEHLAKSKAIKVAQNEVDAAQAAFDEADDAVRGAFSKGTELHSAVEKASGSQAEFINAQAFADKSDDVLAAAIKERGAAVERLSTAQENLATVQSSNAASFQGYSDKISDKFYKRGVKAGSNWRELGFVKGTTANVKGVGKSALGDLGNGIKTIAKPVTKPIITAKNIITKQTTIPELKDAVVNTFHHPGQAIKTAIAASPVPTIASAPGFVGGIANSGGRAISTGIGLDASTNASTYNLESAPQEPYQLNETSVVEQRIKEGFGKPQPDNLSDDNNIDDGNNNYDSQKSPSRNYNYENSSPGNSSPGYSSPGYSSPGNSSPSSTDTAQLKKNDDAVKDVEKIEDQPKQQTPEQTPIDTPAAQPQQDTPAGAVYEPQQSSDGGNYTTYHTGGGYSGDGYYPAETGEELADLDTLNLNPLDETLLDNTTSIDEIVKGSKYTKIPSTTKPITTTTSTGSGSSAVIPIAAGLSAAAAAGIGAKAYMDRKKNNDVGDDEDDDFETEEWTGDEDEGIKYDESSDEQYLDADDDYSYQATESEEKYGARSSDELADLQ